MAAELLPRKVRSRLLVLVVANMTLAVLDLIGVALVGVLGVVLVSAAQGSATAPFEEAIPWAQSLPPSWTSGSSAILIVGGLATGFLVAKSLLGTLLSRRTLRFLARQQTDVSERLSLLLFARPLGFIERRTSQSTSYALTGGVTAAVIGLLGAGAQALAEISLLLLLGAALLYANPLVTVLAATLFAGLAAFMHAVLGRWAGRNGVRGSQTTFLLTQHIQETIASYRELLASGRLPDYVRGWAPLYWRYADSVSTAMFITQLPKYVYETALLLGALVLAAWEFSSRSPAEAVATVALFLAAGSRIMPSMLRLQNALVSIRSSAGQADPTFSLYRELRTFDDSREVSSFVSVNSGDGGEFVATVSMTDVVACYEGSSEPALSQVTVAIPPGARVAVVGATGSGKSTLVDVMLGVRPPDAGTVLVSGLPPRRAIEAFPGRIAYVPQNVSLIHGTIRENVALGLEPEEVDDRDVWQALDAVRLVEVLETRREGLDTLVGERGVSLSGGQRQRVGLARALLQNPRLLVMDEATSALDAETEAAINRALQQLSEGTTTITIAHRLATVRECDVVLYIEDGRLVAQGRFDEVRAKVPGLDRSARLLGL
jgi:ABC-type multidrug transport system fused ATPase/permease subunit